MLCVHLTGSLGQLNIIGNALASGLTLTTLIYALGEISGCHINPAVTLAFAAKRMFPWRWVVLYWASQLCGACVAGAALLGFYGQNNGSFSVNGPLNQNAVVGAGNTQTVYTDWVSCKPDAIAR